LIWILDARCCVYLINIIGNKKDVVNQENQMKITGFIWQEKIVDKLKWKHNLTTDEVEEIFQDKPRFLRTIVSHFFEKLSIYAIL